MPDNEELGRLEDFMVMTQRLGLIRLYTFWRVQDLIVEKLIQLGP